MGRKSLKDVRKKIDGVVCMIGCFFIGGLSCGGRFIVVKGGFGWQMVFILIERGSFIRAIANVRNCFFFNFLIS